MSDYIHLTADEFASLAAKANAAQTVGYFIRNLDTLKLELHFEREAYDALTDDAKRETNPFSCGAAAPAAGFPATRNPA